MGKVKAQTKFGDIKETSNQRDRGLTKRMKTGKKRTSDMSRSGLPRRRGLNGTDGWRESYFRLQERRLTFREIMSAREDCSKRRESTERPVNRRKVRYVGRRSPETVVGNGEKPCEKGSTDRPMKEVEWSE